MVKFAVTKIYKLSVSVLSEMKLIAPGGYVWCQGVER